MGTGEDHETGQWIIDSGASIHCTSDANLLHDYSHMEKPYELVAANGEVLKAAVRGSVNTERFRIPDVLFVPELERDNNTSVNIVSVAKLIHDHGFSVNFINARGRRHCVVMDKTGKEVGRAAEKHGLFVLDYLLIGKDDVHASLDAEVSKKTSRAKDKVHRRDRVWELLLRPLGSIWELFQRLLVRSTYSDDQGPHNEWVLDSGASIHHTSKLELLLHQVDDFQFQEMDSKQHAPSSAADALNVQGRGSVRTDCFDFPGVHYVVGDDTRNVVSVSQLARDHGLVTVFEPTSCHVKEMKTGKIVGEGRLRNGRYMLDSLHIAGQHVRDGGASGRGDRHNGADGGGDSTAEGRGGGGRDGRRGGGGAGATNQEESSASGAAEGDVNEINGEGESGDEREIEEMDDNGIKEIGEINGKGEKEDDERRGGENSGQLSSRSHTGLYGMSRLDCILWIVCILCIAVCTLQLYTGWGAGVTILPVDFHSLLVAGFLVLFILSFQVFKTWMSTICKEEETLGPYLQELSHQEHNKRLFGLSRFHATTDPRWHLPARAFPTLTTNTESRPEHFFLDSGAAYHTTWNESILYPYPLHLQNHTRPPTMSLGGIAAGSIAVTRSGYLNGDKIMIDGVLLALEAQANLVSVGQLSNQYDVNVQMDAEGVVVKNRDGVQVGGGKMPDDSHHFVLQYFRPERLFAHLHTPHPKIFGRSRPGPA